MTRGNDANILDMAELSKQKRRVRWTILTMGLISAIAYKYNPFASPDVTSTLDKLVYTARWQVFSLLTLLVGTKLVIKARAQYPAAFYPMNKEGEKYTEVYNRCLQNTLEQLVLSVPGQLILCTYLETESLKAIPLLVTLFVIGRIFYWLGYPSERAAGFALTSLPTVAVYVLNTYYMITIGPMAGLGGK